MPKKKKEIKINECILSIDSGTQSVRAIIFDLSGNIVDIVKTPVDPYYSEHPGWAEQDPEYYWTILCSTCKKLFSKTRVPKDAVKGVTLTCQRDTMINLDREGNALRPAIVWMDQRKSNNLSLWPPFYLKPVLYFLNLMDAVNFTITEAESNWIRQNQPDIWDKTYKYVFLSGFLTHRLTGEFVDSTANQVGFVPFDYKKQKWAKKSHNYWKRIPIEKDKLVRLVKPAEELGRITLSASEATGIPAGLPVIAAATDKACEVLGSGCLTPEIACLSYGTTATVETTNEQYVEIIPFIPPFPSAIPGAYNTEVMIYRGFWMVSWFKKEFGLKERQIAEMKDIEPEVLFDELLKEAPPGSMGLMLQPYWTPGVKIPGPEAKGAIIGFGDVHTRAHVYRAILEGLAYALKEGTVRTEKRNKVRIERLRVSGGGSQSNEAMQITADIFDLPAERPHIYETSALGAAIDVAVGLKLYPDFKGAVQAMTRMGEIFFPVPHVRDIYKDLYEKVYLKIYNSLKPLYREIKDITGYPKKA
ncbi:MAG: FGGY-family carbohydrate kinase [Spirochaetes bacterium]|nr:FGGY-family carbohydrate kinase [Spirochaetota bacterium]